MTELSIGQQWLRELFEFENCAECGQDETGHTVGPDPLGLPHAWCQHYHVRRHGEDDDIYRTWDMGSAMDYAATELDLSADSEHSMIRELGEAEDFEEAYKAWDRSDTWGNLVDNARNIAKQYAADAADRAPLYRDDTPETRAALRSHAEHVMEMINRDGPRGFAMWVCLDPECAPSEDDDE